MDRRAFLKAATGAAALAAGTGGVAAPALAQGAAARTLRFVPQANLANFDPIWGTQYVVRNASAMVWDLLYGLDDKLQVQRQMVEAEEASPDGLTYVPDPHELAARIYSAKAFAAPPALWPVVPRGVV